MTINWQAGKTETIMVYRGRGARMEKIKLFQKNGERMFVVKRQRRLRMKARELENVEVHVVSSYNHLGSIIDESNNLVPEARH